MRWIRPKINRLFRHDRRFLVWIRGLREDRRDAERLPVVVAPLILTIAGSSVMIAGNLVSME